MPIQVRGLVLVGLVCAAPTVWAVDDVAGHLMLINDNAGWSWFEDERAIVDLVGNRVLVGSVANSAGTGGAARSGKVEVASFGLADRRASVTPLVTMSIGDDHNSPALLTRPDGKYLAVYSGHGTDNLTRYRISTNPGDASVWQAEQPIVNAAFTTYANVFRLSAEGKTYNFTRTVGYDPNVMTSTNDGSSWSYVGKLLQDPANGDATRPYVKYASNGTDKVYFITTEGHPRDVNNGIYAGYMQGGNLFKTDGTLVGALGSAPSATSFSTVLGVNSVVGGTTRTNAWTTDLSLDGAGNPVAAFTSRVAGSSSDHRFYYGRLSGGQWNVTELAKAGAGLYTPENDYTGLVALNPNNANSLYISTPIDPRTDTATAHHEIYKGVTSNGGASWTWTAITSNSTVDNIRPVVPAWGSGEALFWMRGTYTSYTSYDMAAVGLVQASAEQIGKLMVHDATLTNTTRADGQAWTTTGPSGSAGASDGHWHVRDGVGNGGSVLTANESGAVEDTPVIKTLIDAGAPGTYDVWALFWANPAEDWQISAGLSPATMRVFEQNFSEQAALDDFADGSVVVSGQTVNLYKAYLGRVDLAAAGGISVFVDSSPNATGAGTRTWYDGVALAPVSVPEPGMIGVVGFAMMLGRQRRPG